MTLTEIEALDSDFLSVQQVASCIHCDSQLIRDEASKSPKYLGFPITKIGSSYRIPRIGFLNWAKGLTPVFRVLSSNKLFREFEEMGIGEERDAD